MKTGTTVWKDSLLGRLSSADAPVLSYIVRTHPHCNTLHGKITNERGGELQQQQQHGTIFVSEDLECPHVP